MITEPRHPRENILTYLDSVSKTLSNKHIEHWNMLKIKPIGAEFDSHQNIYRGSRDLKMFTYIGL